MSLIAENGSSQSLPSSEDDTSGRSTPELSALESSKTMSGSYTILNGEIKLDRLPSNRGDPAAEVKVKRVPPPTLPKPARPNTFMSG